MGNKLNKQKRRAYEVSISPYCHCPDEEIPEGLSLDDLVSWSESNLNLDPIVGYEKFQAPECYGGHVSEWPVRRCQDCGKLYTDCPAFA